MNTPFEHEIADQLSQLTSAQQQDVLQFVKQLRSQASREERNRIFDQLSGSIPLDDIAIMKSVIEKDCGQVNPDGW